MSLYPVITAGMALTSALLQSMLPQRGIKSSNLSRSSTTSMTADPDLTVPVAANAKYDVDLVIVYNAAATNTGDLQFQLAGPSGATFGGTMLGVGNPLGTFDAYVSLSTTQVVYGNGTGNPFGCIVSGTLFTSGTAGNLVVNWAQLHSNATATTLMTGCKLRAARCG